MIYAHNVSVRQRLYPTPDQESVLGMHCAHARFIYNLAVEQRSWWTPTRRYFAQKINLATQSRDLTEARAEFDWLRAGSVMVQQQALRDADRAFTNFFARRAKFPSFKRRGARESFAITNLTVTGKSPAVRKLNRKWGEVQVPKVGAVRFRLTDTHWPLITSAKSARITHDNGRWFVAFVTAPPEKIVAGTGRAVGIDRGVANSIATSDGVMHHAPSLTPGEQRRFLALQRQLARQHRGSRRRAATLSKLGRLRGRLADRRREWVETTTTTLARDYDYVAVEALRTTNMTRRPQPKPDPDRPGVFLSNGARAKAGLNRAILASCWGTFATRLEHKIGADRFTAVDPRNTSRRCNRCGHTAAENRESQAVFTCTLCAHTAHADVNAARNVLALSGYTPGPYLAGDRACKPSDAPGAESDANRLLVPA